MPKIDLERIRIAVDEALKEAKLGEVVRVYEVENTCGFDISLNDFVGGVDLIRKQLADHQAPEGTLIEYSGGDLPIYDD